MWWSDSKRWQLMVFAGGCGWRRRGVYGLGEGLREEG